MALPLPGKGRTAVGIPSAEKMLTQARSASDGTVPSLALRACVLACMLFGAGILLRANAASAQEGPKQPDAKQIIPMKEPSPDQLFRAESEATWRQRVIDEARRAGTKRLPVFPPDKEVKEPFLPRVWPHMVAYVEPSYVCYGRLLFEQINAERYGWDFGPISPLVSMAKFYYDVLSLPYNLATDPCRCCECSNSGYCLPGSPVPLMLYPPEFSITGTLAEGAVIAALFLIFP
ncbi:MAG TPA: hypothetical protein VEL76_29840 [Gemmataceae bacterium]|nr:hypothetical protein [Gemmataceae bacterium]